MTRNRQARQASQSCAEGRHVLGAIIRTLLVLGATLALLAGSVPTLAQAAPGNSRRSGWWVRPTYKCAGVHIKPGTNIQAKIDAHPEKTTFCINKGVHRLVAPLLPKSGDRFIGQGRAILSGARVLRSFTRSGSYWLATGQTQESAP